MAGKPKITTGPNDRPVDETIGQSGAGLPDDSSRPLETDEAQVERLRRSLKAAADRPEGQQNPDMVPSGTPGAGENVCRRCAGTGEVEGGTCPDCGGSGKVTTPIGGA